jgi:hypothetical protein
VDASTGGNEMKTKKLIKKYYRAIILHKLLKQKKLYKKLLRKSLKHKKTQAIQ